MEIESDMQPEFFDKLMKVVLGFFGDQQPKDTPVTFRK